MLDLTPDINQGTEDEDYVLVSMENEKVTFKVNDRIIFLLTFPIEIDLYTRGSNIKTKENFRILEPGIYTAIVDEITLLNKYADVALMNVNKLNVNSPELKDPNIIAELI